MTSAVQGETPRLITSQFDAQQSAGLAVSGGQSSDKGSAMCFDPALPSWFRNQDMAAGNGIWWGGGGCMPSPSIPAIVKNLIDSISSLVSMIQNLLRGNEPQIPTPQMPTTPSPGMPAPGMEEMPGTEGSTTAPAPGTPPPATETAPTEETPPSAVTENDDLVKELRGLLRGSDDGVGDLVSQLREWAREGKKIDLSEHRHLENRIESLLTRNLEGRRLQRALESLYEVIR